MRIKKFDLVYKPRYEVDEIDVGLKLLEPEAFIDNSRHVENLIRAGQEYERFRMGKELGYSFQPGEAIPDNPVLLNNKYDRTDVCNALRYLERVHNDFKVAKKEREAAALKKTEDDSYEARFSVDPRYVAASNLAKSALPST